MNFYLWGCFWVIVVGLLFLGVLRLLDWAINTVITCGMNW